MILGVTGGFGCGKSSILRFFESRSYFTMDADAVCRSFYENSEPQLISCIKENFGQEFFLPDGQIDRKKLADVLFSDPKKMALVTAAIYPLLREKIVAAINQCRAKNRHGVFELPLLYEAGFENYFDAIVAIWCPAELRKQRLAGRNFTLAEIDERDMRQMPPDEKLERADFGIINNGSPEYLNSQLEKLVQNLNL